MYQQKKLWSCCFKQYLGLLLFTRLPITMVLSCVHRKPTEPPEILRVCRKYQVRILSDWRAAKCLNCLKILITRITRTRRTMLPALPKISQS